MNIAFLNSIKLLINMSLKMFVLNMQLLEFLKIKINQVKSIITKSSRNKPL